MPSNEQIVEQEISKATAEELVKVDKGDYEALKQAANQFINQVQLITDMIELIMNKTRIIDAINTIYASMKQSQEYTVKALELQHQFDQQLNDFMGRVVYLSYVNKDGSFYFYDSAEIGKLYKNATKGEGVGKISANKMYESYKIDEKLNKMIQDSAKQRSWTYIQAVKRWESNDTEEAKRYVNSKNTFYWRIYDPIHITRYSGQVNRGHISEGYAEGVINEDSSILSDRGEKAIASLWDIMQLNSRGAALGGDVQLKSDGSIHFAVKSGDFQTARFGQYLRLAYNITQIPSMTLEDFEKALPKLVNFNAITDGVVEAAQKKAEEEAIKIAETVTST